MKDLLRAARSVAPAFMTIACLSAPGLAANGPAASKSQDSVAYQINPAHTGNIALTGGFTAPLTQAWSVDLGGTVSYPLIANGMAFVSVAAGTYNGYTTLLDALDLSTGAVVWEKLLPGDTSWADAAYDGGNVFVLNGVGKLSAFRAKTGKLLWSIQVPYLQGYDGSFGAPTAMNGLVYVQSLAQNSASTLFAYDEKTGVAAWSVNLTGATYDAAGAAAVDAQGVYVGTSNVYALSPDSGTTLWNVASSCISVDAPVYFADTLYIAHPSCGGSMYNVANGAVVGSFAGNLSPVIFDKSSVVITLDGILYDYTPKNDNVRWSFTGDNELASKPIVVNGNVVALSTYGNLYVIDGATGQQLWTTSLGYNYSDGGPDTGLAAGEGTLLVPDGEYLYAFVPQGGKK